MIENLSKLFTGLMVLGFIGVVLLIIMSSIKYFGWIPITTIVILWVAWVIGNELS